VLVPVLRSAAQFASRLIPTRAIVARAQVLTADRFNVCSSLDFWSPYPGTAPVRPSPIRICGLGRARSEVR
jgi:hypothetical protein